MKPRESLADACSQRQEQASSILDHPEKFKVCESCGSIAPADQDLCPRCKAYRFDDDHSPVIMQAIALFHGEEEFFPKDVVAESQSDSPTTGDSLVSQSQNSQRSNEVKNPLDQQVNRLFLGNRT